MFHFSTTTREIWKSICDNRLTYLIVVAVWICPILLSLPKSYEKGVTFEPGGNNTDEELGYLCYPVEADQNGSPQKVIFTNLQQIMNMVTDISLFVVIVISYVVTWCIFKKEAEGAMDVLPEGCRREEFNEQVKHLRKSLSIAIGLVSVCFLVLRLPLIIFVRELDLLGHTGGGGKDGIAFISPGLGICVLLFQLQFCVNFVIYAIFMADYRNAFLDALYLMCPCCFKWPRNHNNEDMKLEESPQNS